MTGLRNPLLRFAGIILAAFLIGFAWGRLHPTPTVLTAPALLGQAPVVVDRALGQPYSAQARTRTASVRSYKALTASSVDVEFANGQATVIRLQLYGADKHAAQTAENALCLVGLRANQLTKTVELPATCRWTGAGIREAIVIGSGASDWDLVMVKGH